MYVLYVYGELALTALFRSSDSNHKEWVVHPVPPLYKKSQVRAKIFGFPVTEDDLYMWAIKHNTRPGGSPCIRRNAAWKAICVRLPPDHRRITAIRDQLPDNPDSISMCFVIGTNLNANDLALTQDTELIKSLYDAIDMGNRPGWFYLGEP